MKTANAKPKYTKKRTVKKTVKRSVRKLPAKARVDDTMQILNRGKQPVYSFKKTILVNNVAGTGVNVPLLLTLNPATLPDYTNFSGLYDQMKVTYLKYRFTLTTIETTDNALIPYMYCRYMWDKDLVVANVSEAWFRQQRNVVKKSFPPGQHQTTFEYTLTPKVMHATINDFDVNGNVISAYVPRKAGWFDMESPPLHYGLALLFPTLATGQNVNIELEVGCCFREDY